MRRVSQRWDKLMEQLQGAAQGISGEPGWPAGAPTQAEVQAAADLLLDIQDRMVKAANEMQGLRVELRQAMTGGIALLRKVIGVAEWLKGSSTGFGVRAIDRTRNSAGPTPQVKGLVLSDGPGPGTIAAKWKRVPRATYEVQWFGDESLSGMMGAVSSAQPSAVLPGLAPGTQIWLRVRALRGKRHGEWSVTATRIANV